MAGALLNLRAEAARGEETPAAPLSQERGVFGYFCLLFVSIHTR